MKVRGNGSIITAVYSKIYEIFVFVRRNYLFDEIKFSNMSENSLQILRESLILISGRIILFPLRGEEG
jgi:hypothetical protein